LLASADVTEMAGPIYLSPAVPRWTPQTEADLQQAIEQGLLEESHYLEFKRELLAGKAKNRELARDLASLAVDGGTLIVGVDDDGASGVLRGVPVPLAGLAERVESIAETVPDPPLPVLCRSIPSATDPAVGYLLVHVPPSAVAPHMVDHRYLGRGDKKKLYLSDSEVRRLHLQRRAVEQDGLGLLQRQFDRDPVPAESRRQAHLFVLAEPAPGRQGMLLQLVADARGHQRLLELVRDAEARVDQTLRSAGASGFSPGLHYAIAFALRSTGVALTSGLTLERKPAPKGQGVDEDIVELEVDEDGGVRVLMGRFSDVVGDPFASQLGGEQMIFPSAGVMYVRQFIALVTAIAESVGYLGPWILAAGATGIQNLAVYDFVRHGDSSPRYDAPDYRRATTTSYVELAKQPGALAERLVGRLLRSLGVHNKYHRALADPHTSEEAA
jgi:hypothetical protein